jgi:hypothetical protein
MVGKFAEDTALQGLTLSPQEGRLVAVVDSQARKGTFHRAADAVVDSYIENLSERSGPWLTAGLGKVTPAALRDAVGKLGNAAKGRLLSAALVKSLVAKNPRVPLSKIHTFLKGAHIGGTFEEMGEERVGSLARDLWRGVSSDQWGLTLPSGEDLAVEFLTFLVPGAANAVSTHRHFSRLDHALRASDTESHAHLEGLSADPAAHAQRLSTRTGQTIAQADLAAARDLTGPIHAADAVPDSRESTDSVLQRQHSMFSLAVERWLSIPHPSLPQPLPSHQRLASGLPHIRPRRIRRRRKTDPKIPMQVVPSTTMLRICVKMRKQRPSNLIITKLLS